MPKRVDEVFVFGASGHAKVVIDILERMKGVNIAFVVDDAAQARGAKLSDISRLFRFKL